MRNPVACLAVCACCAFCALASGGQEPAPVAEDAASIRRLLSGFTSSSDVASCVFSLDFESPFKPYKPLAQGFSIRREGLNGSQCLVLERVRPGDYHLFSEPMTLRRNKDYVLKFWARGDGLRKRPVQGCGDGFVLCCVEFYRQGTWTWGIYPAVQVPGKEWGAYEVPLQTNLSPAQFGDRAIITLCMSKGWVGRVWIDSISLEERGEHVAAVLNEPTMLTFRRGRGVVALQTKPQWSGWLGAHVTLTHGGQRRSFLLTSGEDGRLRCDFGLLSPGTARLDVELLDMKKRLRLTTQSYGLNVLGQAESAHGNRAVLDAHGRLFVNGSLFMPIGVYAEMGEADFRRISSAGFNCLQGYNSMFMAPREGARYPKQSQNITAMLDKMDALGLKYIFNMGAMEEHREGAHFDGEFGHLAIARKVAGHIGQHPALLAYYLADERPLASVQNLLRLRQAISAVDPHHPVWAVTMGHQSASFPYYGICTDICGLDVYPFGSPSTRDPGKVLKELLGHYERMGSAGLPHWAVPQLVNLGIYRPKKYRDYRWPTLAELRALTLLHAICGAKGFIYYSEFDFRNIKLRKLESAALVERKWAEICQLPKMLTCLQPYLLSLAPRPNLEVKADKRENLAVRGFRNDEGKLCVLAVAMGSVRGVVELPSGRVFRSLYGVFGRQSGCQIQFSADTITGDVLLEE